ncbi:hypothetical protein PYW08_010145 [Mythimna loreyi]|uniref:Uncharacterized protein n=1 Tax=Mythimna loreyi TaxID=667449 RepID=A0ACC2Q646_9NEOP|nr:hypothetical protein PYW08_010145 [Mythimna loreyi]
MFSPILFTIFVVSATAWEVVPEGYELEFSPQDQELSDDFYGYLHQPEHRRQTRQLHGSTMVNSDGSTGINAKLPFAGNDKNVLSAIGAVNFDANRHLQSGTAGLALDNVNGHGLSLTNTHIPNFGERVTAAGHARLFHNPNHDVTANAFATRNMPSIPQVPNFNTYGGGLDYMYKNRIGASLNAAHTPLLQRTDYSATGNLNLFRGRDSSLDFNAGLSKSVSPFMKSSWEPSTGFTFRKFF